MKVWDSKRLITPWLQKVDGTISEHVEGDTTSTVLFSTEDEEDAPTYRYFLSRIWDPTRPPCVVCMTNPSTADAFKNDPTVGRMIAHARRWNCGGLIVLNVFAYRARDPADVIAALDPVGVWNIRVIRATLAATRRIFGYKSTYVVAWGALAPRICRATKHVYPVPGTGALADAVARTIGVYNDLDIVPRALAISKEGHPKHPLYLPSNSSLIDYHISGKI